jgi:CDP-diacylglycerol--serine O-phosphatidyltransferase
MNGSMQEKPFSMIREFHLADWCTLGNAICGTAALFSTITYVQTGGVRHLYFAGALVLAALIFDVVDGRVARWRQTSSALGRESPRTWAPSVRIFGSAQYRWSGMCFIHCH